MFWSSITALDKRFERKNWTLPKYQYFISKHWNEVLWSVVATLTSPSSTSRENPFPAVCDWTNINSCKVEEAGKKIS